MRGGSHAMPGKSKPGNSRDIQEEAPRSRTGNKKGTGEKGQQETPTGKRKPRYSEDPDATTGRRGKWKRVRRAP
jgi:hypothetical protein